MRRKVLRGYKPAAGGAAGALAELPAAALQDAACRTGLAVAVRGAFVAAALGKPDLDPLRDLVISLLHVRAPRTSSLARMRVCKAASLLRAPGAVTPRWAWGTLPIVCRARITLIQRVPHVFPPHAGSVGMLPPCALYSPSQEEWWHEL